MNSECILAYRLTVSNSLLYLNILHKLLPALLFHSMGSINYDLRELEHGLLQVLFHFLVHIFLLIVYIYIYIFILYDYETLICLIQHALTLPRVTHQLVIITVNCFQFHFLNSSISRENLYFLNFFYIFLKLGLVYVYHKVYPSLILIKV